MATSSGSIAPAPTMGRRCETSPSIRTRSFRPRPTRGCVALDARTGKLVVGDRIADQAKGYENTSGPLVANGRVIVGLGGLRPLRRRSLFHQRVRSGNRDARMEVQHDRAQRRAGRRHVGQADGPLSRRRRNVDYRLLRSGPEPDVLGHRAGQAVGAGQPRADGLRQGAVHEFDAGAPRERREALAWHVQHIPGEAMDMDEVFERVLVDAGPRKFVFSIGKAGILWKLDRQTGQFVGYKETVYQNIFDRIDPEDRSGDVPRRHRRSAGWRLGAGMPGHVGRPQLAADELSTRQARLLIIPLAQSCMEIAGRKAVFKEGASGAGGDRRWFEMPGVDGQVAKLAAFDVNTMREVWNVPLRASLLTGVLTTRSGLAFVGDVDRNFRAYDVQTGKQLWQVQARHVGAGISDLVQSRRQTVHRRTTGVGGGSPRRFPLLLTREIHYPIGGNALYVFELPDTN